MGSVPEGAGLSPSQVRSGDAWLTGLEVSSRPSSPGEVARQRAASSEARRVAAGQWVATNMPDMRQPDGGLCSFAVASALRVRDLYPELRGDELVARVRSWRAGWLAAIGTGDVA